MKILSVIAVSLTTLIDVCGQTAQDYCVRTRDWDISSVKSNETYKNLASIQLVSFEGENYGDDLNEIPKDKDGKVALSKMKEIVKLQGDVESRLIDALFNYDYDPKFGGVIETERNVCYIPRNAIVFIDNKNKIICHIEICFECQREEIKVSGNSTGGFCFEKFGMLKEIFKDSGIKYGVIQ